MPENPDFDAIARALVREPPDLFVNGESVVNGSRLDRARAVVAISEQLCLMWNARGAADLAKIDAVLSATTAAPYIKTMNAEIRSLDR